MTDISLTSVPDTKPGSGGYPVLCRSNSPQLPKPNPWPSCTPTLTLQIHR